MSLLIAIEKNSEYAGQVLTNMAENDDLRDLKLVAGIGKQKYVNYCGKIENLASHQRYIFPNLLFRYSVHRLVMMSSSKYFHALLGPNFKEAQEEEVTIANIDGPTLKLVIDFCYTGKVNITDENIGQIIAAASAMELVLIEEKCHQFWNDNLTVSNCMETFAMADQYSFVQLRKRALDMICEYFEEVPTSEMLALPMHCFSELLKCDQIHAVWQEEFIFQRMAQWVDYNEANRSQYAAELFQSIRVKILAKQVQLYSFEIFSFFRNLQLYQLAVSPRCCRNICDKIRLFGASDGRISSKN